MTEPAQYVVVSYIPLLTGEPGDVVDATEAGIRRLMRMIDELPDGSAKAMLWGVSPEGDPWPIFVMPDADRIFDHFVAWAEETPTRWFDLRLATRGSDYAMALVPRVAMSVDRFRLAWELKHGTALEEAASYKILFKSIHFSSKPGADTTFRKVKDLMKPTVKVGFVDSKRFEDVSDIPEDLDPSFIWWTGPFEVQEDKDGLVASMLPKSRNRLKAERRRRG